jgi:hypothetical protein
MSWWGQLLIFLFGFYVGFLVMGLLVIAREDRMNNNKEGT